MKKLISVFAAMALVGSIASAPKKPAPKPAAAAATPVASAMAMAPAASSAGKGMGLFIDLRGTYTFSNGTSDAQKDGTTVNDTNATAVTYKTSASAGFGGGLSIGYDIASGLGVVGSYDIRSIKTREFAQYAGAGTTTYAIQQTWTNQVIGLGLRPHVNALGGEVYAGAGLAIVLPFETTQTNNIANSTTTKQVTVNGYNLSLGAYGELGYKFMFTDMIGLNLGIRAVVATANNIDKTKVVTTTTSGVDTTATTTYKDSFSNDAATAEAATGVTGATKALGSFSTLGITDFGFNVGVSLKF